MMTPQAGILQSLIAGLSAEDRALLRKAGISRQLLYSWRNGDRLPTEPQAQILAIIARADAGQLAGEIALMKATPEQLGVIGKVMKGVQRKLAQNRKPARRAPKQ